MSHSKHESHGGLSQYIAVFIALCVLTLISFGVGNSQNLRENAPQVMWAMMMAVSCAKAMLVIMFFMHLKWEANWKYVLTIPASLMSLYLVLMLVPDIGRRGRMYSEERQLHSAEEHLPHTSHGDHDHSHKPAKSDEKPH
jgi:cytochrome c oxidase subunit 4